MDTMKITFIIVCAAIAIFILLIKKYSMDDSNRYDERQVAMRSKAYKFGFGTVLAYNVLYYLATAIFFEKPLMQDGIAPMVGVCLGLVVFAIECIRNDAFFSIRQNPWVYMLLCLIVVLSNGYVSFQNIRDGLLIKDGLMTESCLQPIITVTFLIIIIAIIVKLIFSREEEE
ncbi:MAG: hypothetical protein IJV39_05500 [Ruminococcus sp.]|nr:hypothetical protein [Ruminococcus sp.]